MEVISKIILGIIQGITEIIPVSSSGHLILISELTGFEIDLPFLTFLHLMTGLAIFWGFWDEIKYIFLSKQRIFLIKLLLLATIPAITAVVLTHNYIENGLRNPSIVIISLIFFGVLMILVDSFFSSKVKTKELEGIKPKNAFLIGFSQILALIPGTSRLGVTIMPAIFMGMDKKLAVTFSFLIGLPLIIGGFFFQVAKDKTIVETMFKEENLIGGLTAFVFAYLAILIFKKLLHTKFLTVLGIYRIILGITVAIFFAI